jgi:hypothetical protein
MRRLITSTQEHVELTTGMEDALARALNWELKGSTAAALARRGLAVKMAYGYAYTSEGLALGAEIRKERAASAEITRREGILKGWTTPEKTVHTLVGGCSEVAGAQTADETQVTCKACLWKLSTGMDHPGTVTHVVRTGRQAVCGAFSESFTTREEATCGECKLEGEPTPRPEYRVHPEITKHDRVKIHFTNGYANACKKGNPFNLLTTTRDIQRVTCVECLATPSEVDEPRYVVWERVGRAFDVPDLKLSPEALKDGLARVEDLCWAAARPYLTSEYFTCTVDLEEGTVSLDGGRFGTGRIISQTDYVASVVARHI